MTVCANCGHTADVHSPAYDDVWVCMVCDCGNYQEQPSPDREREPVGVLRPPRCDKCGVECDPDILHQLHTLDCTRILEGFCQCDLWGCGACCGDPHCATPLATQIKLAHLEHVARVEAS